MGLYSAAACNNFLAHGLRMPVNMQLDASGTGVLKSDFEMEIEPAGLQGNITCLKHGDVHRFIPDKR